MLSVIATLYQVLSTTTRYSIDKTVEILPPTSDKSQPEHYAFGYQPELTYSEERQPCVLQYPQKKALFGDLHIHTALSADAFPDGTRNFPDDVYRFAKGQAVELVGTKLVLQLQQPLDFAAVTDHVETLGEGYICRTPNAFAGYHSSACKNFRKGGESGVREFMSQNAKVFPVRNPSVCGEDNKDCIKADSIVWQSIITSAQKAYDVSDNCTFSSFIGYEYTRSPNGSHMHRNTIFNNASVPDTPAGFFSHPSVYALLYSLEQECRLGIEKCDAISIPHNSNISAGNAFNPREVEGFGLQSQSANTKLRNRFDRLMEITQHKGTSECINGAADILGDVDELCNVEALRRFGKPELVFDLNSYLPRFGRSKSTECSDKNFDAKDNLYKDFCLSSRDFARGALLEGLKQQQFQKINPYEVGFIGSSDTHLGLAGDTDEGNWNGHIAYETELEGRLGAADLGRFNRLVSNPGGLAGVYAVENSRDAIFQSMKRRETFGTSGTRIEPRLFVGDYDFDMCNKNDWIKIAYKNGTPMGSKLPAQRNDFKFLAYAKRDVHSKPLAKLQLIKGWIDAKGQKHNQVIDLIENTNGAEQFCIVYKDLEYNHKFPTYYYLRAVEQVSQRWSYIQCKALDENNRPDNCDNAMPTNIQEMAWTSPIWFES